MPKKLDVIKITIILILNLVHPEAARIHLRQDNGAYTAGDARKPAAVPGLSSTHPPLPDGAHEPGGRTEDGLVQEYILTELYSR